MTKAIFATDAARLWRAAMTADDTYSATIRRLYGSEATRWTLTPRQQTNVDVLEAYTRKVLADQLYLDLCRQMREQIKGEQPDPRD